MHEISVALGDRTYPIRIGREMLAHLPILLEQMGVRGIIALVTDSNVSTLYAAKIEDELSKAGYRYVRCVFPAGEEHKRLERIEHLCGTFLEAGLDRTSLVLALGGGVAGDIAGFAAACFMRGIRFIQMPTTIVAQVDSSVGGKTGVNHPLGKNTIGAFHQPSAVLIDLDFLRTLPMREFRAGMAEVIKHGVIADKDLFTYLEKEATLLNKMDLDALEYPIIRSCEIKAEVVAEDEKEQGLRAILNYGHTFGHGIEAATGYTTWLHGEAIALGMHAAGILARSLGMVDNAFVERQLTCIKAFGLPDACMNVSVDSVMSAMKHDKKIQAGTMKFILPEYIGQVVQRTDVTEEQVRCALETVIEQND